MIKYDTRRCDRELNEELDHSKIFGAPTFPEDYLNRNGLNSAYFFCQINLTEIAHLNEVLPKTGMLYFFLTFKGPGIKPAVMYCNDELVEVMDDVNEIFEELDFKDALYMEFGKGNGSNYILGSFDQEVPESDRDDYVVLLKVDPLNILASDFPIFANPDDELYFVMPFEDLLKLDFKNVKLITHGS